MRLLAKTIGAAAALACASFAQDRDPEQMKKLVIELQQLAASKADAAATKAALMMVVKNAPYTADQISESTQVLGDGTRIHNESKVTITRDSQGRVRRETPDSISIWDPVESVTYMLNPKTMTMGQTRVFTNNTSGSRMVGAPPNKNLIYSFSTDGPNLPEAGARDVQIEGMNTIVIKDGAEPGSAAEYKLRAAAEAGSVQAAAGPRRTVQTEARHESLGVQRMEGISAEGARETSTIEAGAIGNDRPLTIVSERWYSQELQTEMMTKHSDPRTGEQTTHLTNVRLGEPDPSLFQVPAGYQKGGDVPAGFLRKD
jgi:hypothetical protein